MLDRSVIERYPWIEPRSWQLAMLREGTHDRIGIWEALADASQESPAVGREAFLASIERLLGAGLFEAGVPQECGGFEP